MSPVTPPLRSLQAKFLWASVLVTMLVMTSVMVVVEQRQRAAIIDEVQRRGEVLARDLAAISQNWLLLYNFTALEQAVSRVADEADVPYAMVLDAEGRVAAHSEKPDQVGLILRGPVDTRAAETVTAVTQETTLSGEAIYDFAVPVIVHRQKWGTVRVGLSKRRMEAEIRRTRWELGGLTVVTLVLGAVVAALVARRISRPVEQLAAGAAAISRGELNQRIEPTTSDEIGRLAAAFNHMAAQLLQQRTALEDVNTELRRRFEELADLKSYTDNILASLTNGIVTVNLDGRIVTLNPAAELMTGFFAGEVSGRFCTEVFVDTPQLGEILMDTIASRTATPGVALTLRRRNGRALSVEVAVAPLKGGEGKDLGVIGIFRDLTMMRELEHRLRRSDRLAALGGLAAGLAHEIKNPLTSLLTFSRHLSRKFEDRQFRERFQSVVPRELERINGIVEHLLELARPTRLAVKPVRLAPLLDRVVDLCANEIDGKQVRVVRHYARDLPAIWGDPEVLYRALVNLVKNGLEAMGPGGCLTLRLGWSDEAIVLGGPRAQSARRIRIEVEDTGAGIAAADVDRIFNPFFTTKEGGTGLGLALAHKVIEDHGGTLDFRSTAGVGTTFRVVLPLLPDVPADAPGHEDELR